MTSKRNSEKQDRGLLAIAVFKIVKGLGLMAVGFGALHVLHRDVGSLIANWVDLLRIDPQNHYLRSLLEKVANVDDKKLRELSAGTFVYSALFLCEGIGLALQKRWAEYLTIISTASLMPIEIIEIYNTQSAARVILLLVNLAVVVYLVLQLQRKREAAT